MLFPVQFRLVSLVLSSRGRWLLNEMLILWFGGKQEANLRTSARSNPISVSYHLSPPISWHSIQHALTGLLDKEDRHASDSGVSI